MRNGTADVSKTISHHKMLQSCFFIDITVNNYNLPRSLKGAVHDIGMYHQSIDFQLTLLTFELTCDIVS